jgi:hypothetical protein
MAEKSPAPTQNSLLAALGAPEQERLFPQLELAPMQARGTRMRVRFGGQKRIQSIAARHAAHSR